MENPAPNPKPQRDPEARPSGPKGIQSIEVGYKVLLAIQIGPKAVALKTIAARAGLSPSAAHNYLTSFVRTGMVSTDQRGQYRLGPSIAALGMSAARHVDSFDLVRQKAVMLSEQTGLGVAVLIWSHHGPVIIYNKADPGNSSFDLRNGPVSMLTTAGGQLFATHLSRSLTMPVLQREKPDLTDQQCEDLLTQMAEPIHKNGYADVSLSLLAGYSAFSMPVWSANNEVAFALTVTAPADLIDRAYDGPHLRSLREAASELSRLLGAPAERWSMNND